MMTADRPATEPRTEALEQAVKDGLLDLQREYGRLSKVPGSKLLRLHEMVAEAAQGAAPRAEGLQVRSWTFDEEHTHNESTEAATEGRETVARWMIAHGYTTGHGDTTADLLSELESQLGAAPRAEGRAASPAALDVEARKRLLRFIERMKAGLLIEEAVGYEDDQFVRDIEVLLWDGIAPARLTEQEDRR